ncbi:MAG: hypothetical protein H6581_15295 [Bacteroidia bacterium]|nr:hypothetical protein [Bacteroidia bacterium]
MRKDSRGSRANLRIRPLHLNEFHLCKQFFPTFFAEYSTNSCKPLREAFLFAPQIPFISFLSFFPCPRSQVRIPPYLTGELSGVKIKMCPVWHFCPKNVTVGKFVQELLSGLFFHPHCKKTSTELPKSLTANSVYYEFRNFKMKKIRFNLESEINQISVS